MKFSYISLIAAALAGSAMAAAVPGDADANSAQHMPELVARRSPTCDGSGAIVDECKQWCGCSKKGSMNCQSPATNSGCKDQGCKC
ncbi:hypothetical protein BFW01_g1207 [Lasiodiplodia theobromae]|uniref:Uncharacterized protein n=2 Tax=Lasiodiplodia TaxID=66739 RepID=A0A5N5D7S1_9PEZI|nr:hypothetical protein DBV05_g7582 [Lasiodiplodia theobromae]KAF9630645.1 hypothetical protein BFW01_g1207 [Lasiodiplodia theobromae]KAK0621074.1 hypothetical protein DIS24_g11459 [Lasiodiplodia hormozganensis]